MTKKSAPTTDHVAAAKEFIMWARERRIALRTVSVGVAGVQVEIVADMAFAPGDVRAPGKRDVENLYKTFGGDAIARVLDEADPNATYEDDDDAEEQDRKPAGRARRSR